MDKIVSLAKRRGYVYQSSEIYGGLNGCWDYGPLGVELKRNVKERWWRAMVHGRDDIEGLDAAILMHPKVWEASPQKKPPPPVAKPSPAPVANKPEMPTTKNVVRESSKPKKQAVPKQAPKQPIADAEANKRKAASESSQPVKKIKTVNAAPPSSPAAKPKAAKPASATTTPAETVYPNVELLERFNKRLETAKSETVAQYAKPELFTARLNTQITPRQLLTQSADHPHCQILLPILYELWAHELGLPLNIEEPGELLSYDSAAGAQLWVGLDTSMRCYDAVRWCVENANVWSGKKYSVPFVSSTLVRFNVDNMGGVQAEPDAGAGAEGALLVVSGLPGTARTGSR